MLCNCMPGLCDIDFCALMTRTKRRSARGQPKALRPPTRPLALLYLAEARRRMAPAAANLLPQPICGLATTLGRFAGPAVTDEELEPVHSRRPGAQGRDEAAQNQPRRMQSAAVTYLNSLCGAFARAAGPSALAKAPQRLFR